MPLSYASESSQQRLGSALMIAESDRTVRSTTFGVGWKERAPEAGLDAILGYSNFDRKVTKSIDSHTWVDRRSLGINRASDFGQNRLLLATQAMHGGVRHRRVAHDIYCRVIVTDVLNSRCTWRV